MLDLQSLVVLKWMYTKWPQAEMEQSKDSPK